RARRLGALRSAGLGRTACDLLASLDSQWRMNRFQSIRFHVPPRRKAQPPESLDMRKTTLALSLLLAGLTGTVMAADKVTVQLKWLPQAQFAGYYVAAAKGFYKDADLDVTIKPGGPDIAPAQVLAAKGAD